MGLPTYMGGTGEKFFLQRDTKMFTRHNHGKRHSHGKRILSLVLVLIFCIGLFVACSSEDKPATNESPGNNNTPTEKSPAITPQKNEPETKPAMSVTGSISEQALVRTLPDITPVKEIRSGSDDKTLKLLIEKGFEGKDIRFAQRLTTGWGEDEIFIALTNENKLYMWGENSKGELGDGTGIDRSEPILVSEDARNIYECIYIESRTEMYEFYMLKNDDTLWHFGKGVFAVEKLLDNIANVIRLDHLITLSDSFVYQTIDGSLTNSAGTTVMDKVKTAANWNSGGQYSFTPYVLFSDGSLYTFDNANVFSGESYSEKFTAEETSAKLQMEHVSKFFTQNFYGKEVLFTILENGELWGISNNKNGQLGDGTKVPRNEFVKISDNVADVLPGGYGYCKTDGTEWVWTEDDPTPKLQQ
jgi:hypothetical protein